MVCEDRERVKDNPIQTLCRGVQTGPDEVRYKSLLSSLGGTHMEEHSLETPAGRWLRPLSGPGSAASETGSEKMRGHGRGRWSPPSRLAHWWPQDATPQPPQSPGEGWRPTRVLGPDRPGLRTQATTGQAHMSHLSRKQRSQKHGRYLNPRGNI